MGSSGRQRSRPPSTRASTTTSKAPSTSHSLMSKTASAKLIRPKRKSSGWKQALEEPELQGFDHDAGRGEGRMTRNRREAEPARLQSADQGVEGRRVGIAAAADAQVRHEDVAAADSRERTREQLVVRIGLATAARRPGSRPAPSRHAASRRSRPCRRPPAGPRPAGRAPEPVEGTAGDLPEAFVDPLDLGADGAAVPVGAARPSAELRPRPTRVARARTAAACETVGAR